MRLTLDSTGDLLVDGTGASNQRTYLLDKTQVSKVMKFVSKNDEVCIKDEESFVKNEEICIQNEEFCISNDAFCRRCWTLSTCISVQRTCS